MCGIVGFVRKPRDIRSIDLAGVIEELAIVSGESSSSYVNCDSEHLAETARALISRDGIVALVHDAVSAESISIQANALKVQIDEVRDQRDDLSESDKKTLLDLADALWRIGQDACVSAQQISQLLAPYGDVETIDDHIIVSYRSINIVLRSIDRIEVRGRDSAGIGIQLHDATIDPATLSSHAIHDEPTGTLYFTYKCAAEIGELGDNVAHLRELITKDSSLYTAVASNKSCHELVLAHTRWASMGVISESNTHPLDSSEMGIKRDSFALGVLNGDIDNHNQLRAGCSIDPLTTTDAKLIPVLLSRECEEYPGRDTSESFRSVVSRFEGSTAVGALSSTDPSRLLLALRGGGQGLFIGLGDDEFIVASEPYGVVEITDRYIRMDGELPYDANQPVTSRGQICILNQADAGSLSGISLSAYDSTELAIASDDVVVSEVSTRDIDRGSYPHYLWKEINEAPRSFAATLAGKFTHDYSAPELPNDIFPEELIAQIENGSINEVLVIGQGTAAVAAMACEHFFSAVNSDLTAHAMLASEVSGFGLRDSMKDVLVIAVSQSGTTTDTNRTVDLLRDRGARVIAIVNRRGSDLTTKADGVCYTSSGRDVEMSVASTKAFYSQVAAGAYLAMAIDYIARGRSDFAPATSDLAQALVSLPAKMRDIIGDDSHAHIRDIAQRCVLSRRSWATVGNGANSIAAREIRIKSSELCYKAIALDSTEDKKHIDLSSEPLIIVCATGIDGSTADDVAKEIAIYKAHKACPIVITDDDTGRFDASGEIITIPSSHSAISFILACVAGHVLGYESAQAIDDTAKTLREARGALATLTPNELSSYNALERVGAALAQPAQHFFARMEKKEFDAVLDASDAIALAKVFIALVPPTMPSLLYDQCPGAHTPEGLTGCAVSTLTRCIDQLTRPIDAIRHQAKTVTVGISRSDDTLLRSPSVAYLLEAGVSRDLLQYPVIRTLLALDEMIVSITGHTRYEISGAASAGTATISIVEQKGSASNLTSRVASNSSLRGTKSITAREQVVWVTQGKSDGRNVILIPEVSRSRTTGITLLHIDVNDKVNVEERKRILEGYKQRLFALRDAVTETQDVFDESILETIPIMDLLTQPVVVLAGRWSS